VSIKNRLLRLAGKSDYAFDDRINTGYLLRLCWQYGWMIVRGKIRTINNHTIAHSVFIGKHVRFINKNQIKIGEKSKIKAGTLIDALSVNGVTIGSYSIIGVDNRIECTGSLKNIGKGIVIGNNTSFGSNCFFGAAGGIEIGNDVIGGQYIRFHSENHNFTDKNTLIREQGVSHKGIKIGNNCWIGAGAVFLDGAVVGNGCVVGANAVVTKKFPDNSIIIGIPAKLYKRR
jgi:acetyltransferase-like isoleucine patch superfamily enzyme